MYINIFVKNCAKYHCQLRKCKVPHGEDELCEYYACEDPLWFARSEEISFIFILLSFLVIIYFPRFIYLFILFLNPESSLFTHYEIIMK